MTWAEGDGRPARQRAERRHARAQARYEHARLAEHPCVAVWRVAREDRLVVEKVAKYDGVFGGHFQRTTN